MNKIKKWLSNRSISSKFHKLKNVFNLWISCTDNLDYLHNQLDIKKSNNFLPSAVYTIKKLIAFAVERLFSDVLLIVRCEFDYLKLISCMGQWRTL